MKKYLIILMNEERIELNQHISNKKGSGGKLFLSHIKFKRLYPSIYESRPLVSNEFLLFYKAEAR
jgi:hypothetical protein